MDVSVPWFILVGDFDPIVFCCLVVELCLAVRVAHASPSPCPQSGEAVKVVVRSRPFNSKEIAEGRANIVEMNLNLCQVSIRNPHEDMEPKRFTFDAVYDDNSTQRAVYDETGYPLVEAVLQGYNGTMFAYGQVRGGGGGVWRHAAPVGRCVCVRAPEPESETRMSGSLTRVMYWRALDT